MTLWAPLLALTETLKAIECPWNDALHLLQGAGAGRHCVWIIGNGGSAAIASHLAGDAWARADLRAHTFNDAAALSATANDFGYEAVFERPLRHYAQRGDLVWAISSSGQSPNILAAVRLARSLGCRVLTCSGFDATNPLRALGDVSAYVPSHDYGLVEVSHLAIGHTLLDRLVATR